MVPRNQSTPILVSISSTSGTSVELKEGLPARISLAVECLHRWSIIVEHVHVCLQHPVQVVDKNGKWRAYPMGAHRRARTTDKPFARILYPETPASSAYWAPPGTGGYNFERIRYSTCRQTLGSDSISTCGFIKTRAYHGYPSQLTVLVL
jgi:hypothetical protein